jgi:hypothetical protein
MRISTMRISTMRISTMHILIMHILIMHILTMRISIFGRRQRRRANGAEAGHRQVPKIRQPAPAAVPRLRRARASEPPRTAAADA